MKKTSIRDMYLIEMISYTLGLIIVMACGINLPVLFFEKISNYSKALGIIFVIGLTILSGLLVIFSLKKIIALLKDFKSLKSK